VGAGAVDRYDGRTDRELRGDSMNSDHERRRTATETVQGGQMIEAAGFIADDNDEVGLSFEWYGNGDVSRAFPGNDREFRTTKASAGIMQDFYRDAAVEFIGQRLFDLTKHFVDDVTAER
jgi:hypothetical protein